MTQKFAKHFEISSQAHDAKDWDKVAELQAIERVLLDNATPEEQYEYYLRVAKDHTGVDIEKIDRAISAMCVSDDIEVKGRHLQKHFLKKIQAFIIKSELADQNLDGFRGYMESLFNQDVKPLPNGHIFPYHPYKI